VDMDKYTREIGWCRWSDIHDGSVVA